MDVTNAATVTAVTAGKIKGLSKAAAELSNGTTREEQLRILAALKVRLQHADVSDEKFLLLLGDPLALRDPTGRH